MDSFEIDLARGIGDLAFGMSRSRVIELLGEPSESLPDEDDNEVVCLLRFNDLKLTASIYEGDRLGYLRTTNPAVSLDGERLIDSRIDAVRQLPSLKGVDWDVDRYTSFDTFDTYDPFWIQFRVEYQRVVHVELGVPFLNDEEYAWPTTLISPTRGF